jgi:dTDP-4-dehydrorhamnose 3,5-epimerase
MKTQSMPLQGLIVIQAQVFRDERGLFFESYRHSRYAQAGIDVAFTQDNISFSKKNTLRGLHYQETPGQAKLITVVQGAIWDVAVDIRPDSPTYGKWASLELSDENLLQFYIPVGFAHGYYVLSEFARVQYKVSAPFNALTERTIAWDDPDFAIGWPCSCPILSDRDRTAHPFRQKVNR